MTSHPDTGARTPGARDVVDLRPVKRRFCELFPAGHPLREAILREPDMVPRPSFAAKAEAYLSMAWAMRQGPPT